MYRETKRMLPWFFSKSEEQQEKEPEEGQVESSSEESVKESAAVPMQVEPSAPVLEEMAHNSNNQSIDTVQLSNQQRHSAPGGLELAAASS